ncbi:SDR family NAD(P)-dependent oxidoreductase [Rhizobium sp. 2YAF20]|uniref:SDR family NAD(P)-dependent oxidoreductase n=1 Tax=Rhizobium sp. 2YAF20 TaxID=3233027 RepID=UPI003F9DD00E
MIYGPTATADEVLDGRRLTGKRILVTGVSSGVGVETARALACHGAVVVGAVRDLAKGAIAMEALRPDGSFRLVELELSSLESVRTCTAALLAEANPFDLIIANAGVMAVPFGLTVDGFETHFATNYLSHFLLVNQMAPLLRREGRVVMVSSAGHRGADVDLNDPNFERKPYDPLVAYRQSKTATILFAVEFDRRYRSREIRATAVHPGAVLTETTLKLIDAQPSAASAFTWKTVAQGAATSVWAGYVASADEVGGRYAEDCHVAEVNDDPTARAGVRSYALDAESAKALWLASESMVGEAF